MEAAMKKQCRVCLEYLPIGDFDYRGGGRRTQQSDCKFCSRKRAREYRQRMRNLVGRWKLYKGCMVCGFKALHSCQLDLDHVDPENKTYKGSHKAFDAGWSKKRIKEELARCVVTCKNCHALRTYNERHWENNYSTVRMRQSSAQI